MHKDSVCWKCLTPPPSEEKQKLLPENFCGTCQSIQPPEPNASPFDILSAPRQFSLSLKVLEKRFLALQRKLHPDYYHAKSKMEQVYAEARSSQLNKAYQVLRSPTKRAQLLLAERGVEVGESTFQSDPALLMQVLERRELLESIDDSQVDRLRGVLEETARDLAEVYERFDRAYQQGDLAVAKHAAVHMIYLEKLSNLIYERLPLK